MKPISRVGITGNPRNPAARKTALKVIRLLQRERISFEVDAHFGLPFPPVPFSDFSVSLILSFGGDGTLLHRAIQLQKPTPLLGINCGGVGHYMGLTKENVLQKLPAILRGECVVRKLDRLALWADGKKVDNCFALNEVAVLSQLSGRLMRFDLDAGSHRFSRLGGDGLLVSTVSGSSAYNKSAGGPILLEPLKGVAITLISPFDRNLHSWVLPLNQPIKISGFTRVRPHIIVDGQHRIESLQNELLIRKGRPLQLVFPLS
ncbi:MAG: NAD(+)/NADH kinase [Candidatus Diapherotrites archaeon]|nr:NAD(+)/NADH kinase [Candidatus Diapherotrites archaeon]